MQMSFSTLLCSMKDLTGLHLSIRRPLLLRDAMLEYADKGADTKKPLLPKAEANQHEPHSSTEPPRQEVTSSSTDTGSYSCNYHGCTIRFETPSKLQKHKREAHR